MKPFGRWQARQGDHMKIGRILNTLKIEGPQQGAGTGAWLPCGGEILETVSPINGEIIGTIRSATVSDYEAVVTCAVEAFKEWRLVPAPKRGEIVRQIGNALREHKRTLGALVSIEMGKILSEGEGEVQELIDIADFCPGSVPHALRVDHEQ